MNNGPLDSLHQVTADEKLKKDTLEKVMQKHKYSKHYGKMIIAMITCAAAMFIGFIYMNKQPDTAIPPMDHQYSYISIDINPSFELILNENNMITDVKYFNEDAEQLLQSLSLKDKEYVQGLQDIIGILQEENYLNMESYLQVSVYSKDAVQMQQLEETISSYLNEQVHTPHNCMHVDETTHENAQSHHMSFGKYDLIQTILNIDNRYDIDTLNEMSMYELKEMYASLTNASWEGNSHESCGGNHHNQNTNRGNGHHHW